MQAAAVAAVRAVNAVGHVMLSIPLLRCLARAHRFFKQLDHPMKGGERRD